MPKYRVEITETIYREYEVEANSEKLAGIAAMRKFNALEKPDSGVRQVEISHTERED